MLGQWEHQVAREMKMCEIRLPALIFCLLISLHHAYQYEIEDVEIREPDNNFDILIFAQHLPVTVCKFWMNDDCESECAFPNEKNRWTVHGIWPNENYYCNDSWPFDPEEIKSIVGDLEQAWTAVIKDEDPYYFWNHEWRKHGTCATELEPFNSEFKYFNQGIDWNQKYSLSDMLDAANIFPDDTKEINPEEFVNAVKAKTRKSAMMGCYLINGVLYVQELRICFDKQFNLIDCEPPAVDKNCYSSKGVIYPANA